MTWAPRVLAEKPFSTSLPLSVTCKAAGKTLKRSQPRRNCVCLSQRSPTLLYFIERKGPKPSPELFLLSARGAHARTHAITQRAATSKNARHNTSQLPLTEAEICLNSGKSMSRWVRKTSSTGSLAVPLEKIYGAERKIACLV